MTSRNLKQSPLWLAAGLACLAMIFWSGNWVMGRAVRGQVPPLGLNYWRWTIAALVLAPFALRELIASWSVVKSNARLIIALGVTGGALFQSMVYIGLRSTQAINALLLNATAPLFVIFIGYAVHRDSIQPRQLIGTAVSFVGVAFLVGRGDLDAIMGLSLNKGDLWILCAMFLWGIYSVLLRRRPADLGGLPLLFAMSIVASMAQLPLYIYETVTTRAVPTSAASLASLLYAGCFASVAAFLCYNAAVQRMGANRASFFLHLMPVFGAISALAFLGESLHPYHAAGALIIFTGVLVATTTRRA